MGNLKTHEMKMKAREGRERRREVRACLDSWKWEENEK